MTPDKADDPDAGHPDTFNPYSVPDRMTRHVRDDHAPNQALHDALQAANESADDPVTYNLMASHAPGEKPHDPRYHVRVTIENGGMGDAGVATTPVGDLLNRRDVTVVDAYSQSTFEHVDDTMSPDDVVDAHTDRLVLHIRPVEVRVEPIEVDVADVPDWVRGVDYDALRHYTKIVLSEVADNPKTDERGVYEAASALATLLYVVDPDRDGGGRVPEGGAFELEWLTDEVDVPWGFEDGDGDGGGRIVFESDSPFAETYHALTVDGDVWEHGEIESPTHAAKAAVRLVEEHASDDAADAFVYGPSGDPDTDTTPDLDGGVAEALRVTESYDPYTGFPFTERGRYPPTGKPPREPIREWVEDNTHRFVVPESGEYDVDDVVDQIAEAIAEWSPAEDDDFDVTRAEDGASDE